MNKFQVGEVAELIYTRGGNHHTVWYPGIDVQIVEVCPGSKREKSQVPYDYIVRARGIKAACVREDQLRKKHHPRRGSWNQIRKLTGWSPEREEV